MRLLLVGFGSVNRALVELLPAAAARRGARFSVVGVSDSRGAVAAAGGLNMPALLRHKALGESVATFAGGEAAFADTLELEAGVEYDILVESSPVDLSEGGGLPLAVCRAAVARGRHVVLANKSPLVLAYAELHAAAADSGARLAFSATVCGGLPVISVGQRDLVAADFRSVRGIFNSTSNYILGQMAAGESYEAALQEAQARGVAEADPALDVEGWDTANKLVIIANAVLGVPTTLADVRVQGITPAPACAADEVVKLVASGVRRASGDGWDFSVAPVAVPAASFLGGTEAWEMSVELEAPPMYPRVSMKIDEREPVPTAAAVLRDCVHVASFSSAPLVFAGRAT